MVRLLGQTSGINARVLFYILAATPSRTLKAELRSYSASFSSAIVVLAAVSSSAMKSIGPWFL